MTCADYRDYMAKGISKLTAAEISAGWQHCKACEECRARTNANAAALKRTDPKAAAMALAQGQRRVAEIANDPEVDTDLILALVESLLQ
jgi:7-cyano-7-deazaguanine synthase in queuosine biosynthesis